MSKKSLDVLILFVLLLTRVRLDTLADQAVPTDIRLPDVYRLVQVWWPTESLDRLAHPQLDQMSLMLIATAFGLAVIYLLVDLASESKLDRWAYWAKLGLIYSIIGLMVVSKTGLWMNLRNLRGPTSYAHDGGVIQTEITIDYFLDGLNPYVEDYVDTPMADWGINEYRTALYHYPYLPWTFIFAAPIALLSQATMGWFDMRLIYVTLFVLTIFLAQSLVSSRRDKLFIALIIGLNPISNLSIIFGQNDPFVLFWIVLGLWLVVRGQTQHKHDRRLLLLGSAAFGLACASKPTAWFLAPFWLLYLLGDQERDKLLPAISTWVEQFKQAWHRAWTLPLVALLIIGPWFVWNPDAMIDDVWRWSAGIGETGYQIWGWGASNFVLTLGWVEGRFAYWPFIIPSLVVGLPLLLILLRRQACHNTISAMVYGYAVFLFVFFYLSRFMQPNYLGYILDLLSLAYFTGTEQQDYFEQQTPV